ncbi:MAG: HIRAN domain-containing protein [Methanobrevibacter sp.]|uniref:HIRAN domain-containing protein n=1 Tax=Methanobrevibacter sp. TaxID=66852 RepID=UPI0025E05CA0|nr:HIRAN domain-containing protein [Methanobrevibacter sp.]MBQ6099307.1 HIRAN domain-containing protein [Methanobrevibacter sp.]
MYITITAFNNMHGTKPLKLDAVVKLKKDPENKYDTEAIACEMRHFGKIGYVANSTQTVVKGSMSAGRLYDKIGDEYFAKIKFITSNTAIAKVLSFDEYKMELENPDSDVHYLCENPEELGLKEEYEC